MALKNSAQNIAGSCTCALSMESGESTDSTHITGSTESTDSTGSIDTTEDADSSTATLPTQWCWCLLR